MRTPDDLPLASPAPACDFELVGLASGPRLISAILEYAILAGSLLSPYLSTPQICVRACRYLDTQGGGDGELVVAMPLRCWVGVGVVQSV